MRFDLRMNSHVHNMCILIYMYISFARLAIESQLTACDQEIHTVSATS